MHDLGRCLVLVARASVSNCEAVQSLPVMLTEARNPKHLFSKPRCRLPHRAESGADKVALEELFRELVNDYNRNNTELWKTRFVCNFSGHNLTLDHFATWLEGSSLRIYALDFSCNRIFPDSWEPLFKATARLCTHVEHLQLGGNYLPPMTDTDELSKLQMSGRVSLAVPATGSPATQWHKKWNDIATDFSSIAYESDVLHYG